ncbi:hypothetical protein [Nocardioides plantarum]|uniref:Serine/threonine protein kinase n=1 Tax=Nocardioides plantarum TaxID=29299 RepID=A0ABV5K434_9ACTN|nr:hypothetical protein [Nocardioides plantarum]
MTDPRSLHPAASQLLRDATDDLTVDVDLIVRGGIARGRTIRRRRRVGTSLVAAAVVGVIGVAASVGPGLVGDARGPGDGPGYAGVTTATGPAPSAPTGTALVPTAPTTPPSGEVDAGLVVAAGDVPAVFGELLGGEVGPISTVTGSEAVDLPQRRLVHFSYDGTDTTFGIERADALASCAALVDPADQPDGRPGGECVVRDGVELLRHGPETGDGVTARSVMAWRHGYVVSVVTTNGDGKESPVLDEPPISAAELERVALTDRWFSGS